MKQYVDLALAYSFLKNLVTPFTKWPAYKLGLIDKDGNILKPRRERLKQEEKDALGYFDIITLNLKKLLGKFPGGKSAIASYAAALLLLKEYPKKSLKEDYEPTEEEVETMLAECIQEVEQYMEEEAAITNTTAGVAGLTPDSIGVPPAAMKRYKDANKRSAGMLRRGMVNYDARTANTNPTKG